MKKDYYVDDYRVSKERFMRKVLERAMIVADFQNQEKFEETTVDWMDTIIDGSRKGSGIEVAGTNFMIEKKEE